MKNNLETGRLGKKRTVVVGTGLISGVIAGGAAWLLSPGSASAQPTAEKAEKAEKTVTAALARGVAVRPVPVPASPATAL